MNKNSIVDLFKKKLYIGELANFLTPYSIVCITLLYSITNNFITYDQPRHNLWLKVKVKPQSEYSHMIKACILFIFIYSFLKNHSNIFCYIR